MVDIKKIRESLETAAEMVAAGELKEVPDETIDSGDFGPCDLAVCLPVTQENINNIPEMWRAEIAYGVCSVCDRKIFYRDNMPKVLKLVCMECAYVLMNEDREAGEEVSMIVRKKGADELREYLKKRDSN
jgi:hypothetical protein